MIIQETFVLDGRELVRTYSDDDRYVVRDGAAYVEAVDPAELGREYTEGDKLPEEDADAETILSILLGEEGRA